MTDTENSQFRFEAALIEVVRAHEGLWNRDATGYNRATKAKDKDFWAPMAHEMAQQYAGAIGNP